MSLKAVIFDLYGTLVLPFPSGEGRRDILDMARELDVDAVALKQGWSAVRDRDMGLRGDVENDLRQVLEGLGVANVPPDRLRRATEARIAFVRESLVLRPDAVPTLKRLAAAGLRRALVTNCSVEVPPIFRETPLAPLLDPAIYSSDEHLMKPDPRIFQLALSGLGMAGEDCAYVGDGYGNELTGAAAVGMRAIHLATPGEPYQDIPEYDGLSWTGERVSTLSELPALLGVG